MMLIPHLRKIHSLVFLQHLLTQNNRNKSTFKSCFQKDSIRQIFHDSPIDVFSMLQPLKSVISLAKNV